MTEKVKFALGRVEKKIYIVGKGENAGTIIGGGSIIVWVGLLTHYQTTKI